MPSINRESDLRGAETNRKLIAEDSGKQNIEQVSITAQPIRFMNLQAVMLVLTSLVPQDGKTENENFMTENHFY